MYPEGQTLSLHDARPISGSRSPISSRVESADRWKPSRDWRARCASIWKIWCKREFRRSSFASPDPKKPALRFFPRRTIVGAMENRSEEHTSELQSLMRISYAVFCLKKKNIKQKKK